MNDLKSIGELDFNPQPALSDQIIVENLEDPTAPTSRTTLRIVKDKFTGELTGTSEGFVNGREIYNELQEKVDKEEGKGLTTNDFTDKEKEILHNLLKNVTEVQENLGKLGLADISSLNALPVWERRLSDLFRTDLADFNTLQYACCLVTKNAEDFPGYLTDSDTSAYITTHRSGTNGLQLIVGAESGRIASRRMNGKIISEWTKSTDITLIDSYTSEETSAAPTADALRRLYLLLSDKMTELEMIVTGGDISVFPSEIILPATGGTAEIIINATGEWIIYQQNN